MKLSTLTRPYDVAYKFGIVKTPEEFSDLWQNTLIGIGDGPIYDQLNILYSQGNPDKVFLTKDEYLAETQAYYVQHESDAKPSPNIVETVGIAQQNGIQFIVATHAPPELAARQLTLSGTKNLIPSVNIYDGNRLDQSGYGRKPGCYAQILAEINDKRERRGLEPLMPENVLVVDSSKYVAGALKQGFRGVSISQPSDEIFKPNAAGSNVTTWTQITAGFNDLGTLRVPARDPS